MSQHVDIRPASDADCSFLPEVERAADELFRSIPGLEWIADDSIPSPADYRASMAAGPFWIADADNIIVGFLFAELLLDALHIEEVAVHRDWQGRGIGTMLIATAVEAARVSGRRSVSLTTFRHVPWNAPYYERLGFTVVEVPTQRLKRILDSEVAAGFIAAERCAMQMILK